ncbi:hypothetical protein BCR39DRAFT_465115 [Naematelia encephala]|uniref:NAD-dependent epimerase/dehydratase domain-containing protein n=1 Tax=Naematelia encephala TaxID=71784 RepID=A0A1Y2BAQ4_9TREE|nr:hypothetical protein BCR39DRAFT_465115 [Naematelia encephala]
MSAVPKLLVVGGNGFLGSAICKAAVSRGWEVSSMSSSGKPYKTPAGHTPAWSQSVTYHAASAFDPPSFSSLVADSTAVVHTIGILLEDAKYKQNIRDGNLLGLARSLLGVDAGNPLKTAQDKLSGYEGMNRDSALNILDAMLSPTPSSSSSSSKTRPFVYISAADAFRPLIPSRYIETKRQAEQEITNRCLASPEAHIRPLFMRPGLMYHPHIRPLSTLPAFLLSLTATLAEHTSGSNPFASKSALAGAAEAMRTHPIHVDHVAEAVVRCIADENKEGVVEVNTMREWAGFNGRGGRREAAAL